MRQTFLLLAGLAGIFSSGISAAKSSPLEMRDFRLGKGDQDVTVVEIHQSGELTIRLQARQPMSTAPVQLHLEGPDGTRVEKSGSAPLRLRFKVDREERLGNWRAIVSNIGKLPLLSGRIHIRFTPASSGDASLATGPSTGDEITDGKISHAEERERIRASCVDKNRDVSVRLDLHQLVGGFFLGYNEVFKVTPHRQSAEVIELRGSGPQPLYLDTKKKALIFQSGEAGVFCRVRVYYGDV